MSDMILCVFWPCWCYCRSRSTASQICREWEVCRDFLCTNHMATPPHCRRLTLVSIRFSFSISSSSHPKICLAARPTHVLLPRRAERKALAGDQRRFWRFRFCIGVLRRGSSLTLGPDYLQMMKLYLTAYIGNIAPARAKSSCQKPSCNRSMSFLTGARNSQS